MKNTSNASAIWKGNLKEGKGNGKLPSINQEFPYSAASRFEDKEKGTNPEELIAAAHAQCFSMAFANELAKEGHDPEEISTTAQVSIEKLEEGFKITESKLECNAKVSGIKEDKFQELAKGAKKNCPVSMALASLDISLTATLSS